MKTYRFVTVMAVLAVVLVSASSPVWAGSEEKYKDMKGYVDFNKLTGLDGAEATVEVFVHGPLLKLAREAVRSDEPELADILENVHLVRANIFALEEKQMEEVTKKMKEVADALEKKGWDVAVRVREEDENVYIYLLPGPNESIDGLMVMVAEYDRRDSQFILVNVVGNIQPEDIGRLGRGLHIDAFDDLDFDDDRRDRRSR
jgi:hypothetical protein